MNLTEIERKFLVVGDFRPFAASSTHIAQGYIASGNGRTVRVRIRGDKGYLTIKGPSDKVGLARFEWEREITLDEAKALMTICEPGIVEKTRWLVPASDGRHTWELWRRLSWKARTTCSKSPISSVGKSPATAATTTATCDATHTNSGEKKNNALRQKMQRVVKANTTCCKGNYNTLYLRLT